jgi:hypothetical protein
MSAVINFARSLLQEAKVGFVNQRGALESVVWALLPKVMLGDTA